MLITGTFNATGQSKATVATGAFNLSLTGSFDGTVKLERSFDGEAWEVCSRDASGAEAAWTAPASLVIEAPECAWYRLNCTALASGSVAYRFGRPGSVPQPAQA